MILQRSVLATALAVGLATPLAAQESGSLVIRLGRDTTSVETFTRTRDRVVVEQVGRTPRVLVRHLEFDLDERGATTRAKMVITRPQAQAGAPPLQQVDATVSGDSLTVETRRDTTVQRTRLARPAGLLVLAYSSPWAMYEALSARLTSQKADSLRVPMYYLGAAGLSNLSVQKLGRDSIVIETDTDRLHARVDKAGRILSAVPIRGTGQFSADRVESLDLKGFVAAFVAAEEHGAGLGTLSTRDTARAAVGGAALWIDYGRPAKRGRVVFGGVVPWGELWRTGANAATQFRTDKALDMGGTTVPAGFYTLWTIPSPGGWKLVINSETGQWGTAHKADKDLHTVDMKVSALGEPVERFTIGIEPSGQGGVIHMDWDTTRASIPFTVKP